MQRNRFEAKDKETNENVFHFFLLSEIWHEVKAVTVIIKTNDK